MRMSKNWVETRRLCVLSGMLIKYGDYIPQILQKVDLSYLITRFYTHHLGETDVLYYKRMLDFMVPNLQILREKHLEMTMMRSEVVLVSP